MKSHVDLPAWFVPLILAIVTFAVSAGYFKSQQGGIICDAERVGFFLRKDGYRSWSFEIADGQVSVAGKLVTVSYEKDAEGRIIGLKRGHKWPVYQHQKAINFHDGTNVIYGIPQTGKVIYVNQ